MSFISFLVAIFILGVIIFIHEFGHFVSAKFFGVPVYEFSIGMGKRLFSFIKNNTRYSLKVFPFGGSCAMVGEDIAGSGDFTDNIGKINYDNNTVDYDGVVFNIDDIKKNNFQVISPIKKIIICISGPFFNFLLAVICSLIIVLLTGVNLAKVNSLPDVSPAKNATPYSLMSGDIINSIEIPNNKEKIIFSSDLQIYLFLHSKEIIDNNFDLNIGILRNNEQLYTKLTPMVEDNSVKLGIYLSENYYPKNIIELFYYSFNMSFSYVKTTFQSLIYLIKGKFSLYEISGPVGTVAVMGNSISSVKTIYNKFIVILMMINLISTNLAVMNLLPIPALDGGRLLEAFIELLIGKPLNPKIINTINIVTMALLLGLMVLIFGVDIYKIFNGVFK